MPLNPIFGLHHASPRSRSLLLDTRYNTTMGPKALLAKLSCTRCAHEDIPEPCTAPPEPPRPQMTRQGTLRRVGTIKEKSRPSARTTALPRQPSWEGPWGPESYDAFSGPSTVSKDAPTAASTSLVPDSENREEGKDIFTHVSYPKQSLRRQRSDSWDRPLSELIPPKMELARSPSGSRLRLVPKDSGEQDRIGECLGKLEGSCK
jgi:hypothetical protein